MLISKDRLLEIDPEKLFREHSVADLQKIHAQILEEIEKKREELRTTVGERYRDLLKVADTIRDMKDTASDVVHRIRDMTEFTQTLQEKHLLGFKSDDFMRNSNLRSSENISKILEIKLLTTIPERIWTAIDKDSFLEASEIYLLAEHTHLGLQVSRVRQQFPIVDSLWGSIASCKINVLSSARGRLSQLALSAQGSADCFSSILLLEPKSSLDMLKEYLEIRQEAFSKILDAEEYSTVKDKLRAAVDFVQQTCLVACLSFLDGEAKTGLTKQLIHHITGDSAQPTLSKFSSISPLSEKYLTHLVKDYKPRTPPFLSDLSEAVVRERLLAWMESIQQILKSQMPNLLGLISNLRGVVAVRKMVSSVDIPDEWNEVEAVLGTYSVYDLLMEPHIAARTLQLIEGAWREAVTSVINALAVLDEQLLKESKDGKHQSENNIKWFLWKEMESNEVTLQRLGCTPRVSSLCSLFEKHLKNLLEDVTVYASNVKDRNSALTHLNLCSFDSIKILAESMRDSETLRDVSESSLIVRARLLQALPSQCPSLEKSVRAVDDTKILLNGRSWTDLLSVLMSATEQMWRVWLSHIKVQIHGIVTSKLDPDVTVATFLLSRPASEVVTITEEAEDGKKVSSQLRVPAQPSLYLQETLLQICLRLNAIAVHSLPKLIRKEVIILVIDMILTHYEELRRHEIIYQSHAWQMLLDVRFLALLFLPHDHQSRAQTLFAQLESIIDPFDLNVCYPYLQANVKKCAIRLQGTFGVLVDHGEKLAVLNSLKVCGAPQEGTITEEPVVLAVSSSVPWFPLLPISSGISRKKDDPSERHSKPPTKNTKKETASSDFVKTAGAFFGAMTGGWS